MDVSQVCESSAGVNAVRVHWPVPSAEQDWRWLAVPRGGQVVRHEDGSIEAMYTQEELAWALAFLRVDQVRLHAAVRKSPRRRGNGQAKARPGARRV